MQLVRDIKSNGKSFKKYVSEKTKNKKSFPLLTLRIYMLKGISSVSVFT